MACGSNQDVSPLACLRNSQLLAGIMWPTEKDPWSPDGPPFVQKMEAVLSVSLLLKSRLEDHFCFVLRFFFL